MIMIRHSVTNNTRLGLVASLCSNLNYLISLVPRTASNFGHLLSCGTIGPGHSKMLLNLVYTHCKKRETLDQLVE